MRRSAIGAVLVLLLTLPVTAYAYANTITGTVQSLNRDLNYFTVVDQATGHSFKVDVRHMNTRQSVNVWQLRPGDLVMVNGKWTKKHDTYRANRVNYSTTPMSSAYAANMLMGTVDSTNRDLNYITVHNDATGQPVKIDVRKMDTRRSVNVWTLRAGDRVHVSGSWAKDRFVADTVNF